MLEAQGLDCWLTGDQMATTLSLYGAALSQIELWVKAEDVEQAAQILAELTPEDRGVDRWGLEDRRCWQCTTCQEPNEQSFDECWSCSSERTDDAILVAADESSQVPAATPPMAAMAGPIGADASPYRTPATDAAPAKSPIRPPGKLTARAFRAMIFGIVFPLPVMFFAASLSVKAYQQEPHSWRLWAALLVSVPVTLVASMWLLISAGSIARWLL